MQSSFNRKEICLFEYFTQPKKFWEKSKFKKIVFLVFGTGYFLPKKNDSHMENYDTFHEGALMLGIVLSKQGFVWIKPNLA